MQEVISLNRYSFSCIICVKQSTLSVLICIPHSVESRPGEIYGHHRVLKLKTLLFFASSFLSAFCCQKFLDPVVSSADSEQAAS